MFTKYTASNRVRGFVNAEGRRNMSTEFRQLALLLHYGRTCISRFQHGWFTSRRSNGLHYTAESFLLILSFFFFVHFIFKTQAAFAFDLEIFQRLRCPVRRELSVLSGTHRVRAIVAKTFSGSIRSLCSKIYSESWKIIDQFKKSERGRVCLGLDPSQVYVSFVYVYTVRHIFYE